MSKFTASTITDEQIRELRDQGLREGNYDLVSYCHQALPPRGKPRRSAKRDAARARCAEILNARNAKVQP